MSKQTTTTGKISEADLKNKLQAFQDGLQGKVEDQKSTLLTIGGVTLVVLLLAFFLLGKRSGKKRTTLVEIRRV